MQGKPQRQIGDHPDHRRGNRRQCRLQRGDPLEPVHPRRAGEYPQEAGSEGYPGGESRTQQACDQRRKRAGITPGSEKAGELRHHDQRPRRGFSQPQPVGHFARRQPVEMLDRLLRHIGEHGVSTAESDHCQLGKERADIPEHRFGAQRQRDHRHRQRPDRQPDQHGHHRRPGQLALARLIVLRGRRGMGTQPFRLAPADQCPGDPGDQDHQRKWCVQQGQRQEGQCRQPQLEFRVERPLADADQCLHHDPQHRRLDPEEQRRKPPQPRCHDIEQRQAEHDDRAGNDKQQSCRQPAPDPVQPPTDPRRQLLRLGPGQQVAEIECAQKRPLIDPFALVDQLMLHQRDLPGGAAEAEEANPGEGAQEIGEGGRGSFSLHELLRWLARQGDTCDTLSPRHSSATP